MPHQKVTPFLRSAARHMRSRPIDAEQSLWWELRDRKLGGLKFRRQHPVGRFIADFVCMDARLIVEVDGKQHEGSLDDIARTEELVARGFRVMRIPNDRARVDLDRVCEEILAVAMCRPAHPSSALRQSRRAPSPTRGEG
jgi:very-short-patch-repair endonuclease